MVLEGRGARVFILYYVARMETTLSNDRFITFAHEKMEEKERSEPREKDVYAYEKTHVQSVRKTYFM